jgi:hypothetical protein
MKIIHESFLQKGIVVLIFLAFLTPLIISPFGAFFISVYPKTLFFRLIIEIAFLLYIFLLFKNKNYLPKFSFISFFISLYFFILLISSVFGFNLGRSFWGNMERWEGLILQLHLLLFFFIITAVLRQKHWVEIFKFAVCVSAGVSISGILQKISFFKFLNRVDDLRISGTILNPDFFCRLCGIGFFSLSFRFVQRREQSF